MLAKLDADQNHTCGPVWRPTTADEIQAGWEVRSRGNGIEATWGVAHHRDDDCDWRTETGAAADVRRHGLDVRDDSARPRAEAVARRAGGGAGRHDGHDTGRHHVGGRRPREVRPQLAAKFPGVRAAIAGGEQS